MQGNITMVKGTVTEEKGMVGIIFVENYLGGGPYLSRT